jgi:hypothetical protein
MLQRPPPLLSSFVRPMTNRQLESLIEDAFAKVQYPSGERLSVPTNDDEGTHEHFCGTHWRDHSAATLQRFQSALWFFTPAAFAYFLPAYMLAVLKGGEPSQVIWGHILAQFSRSSRAAELLPALSCDQVEALRHFMRYVCEGIPDGDGDCSGALLNLAAGRA